MLSSKKIRLYIFGLWALVFLASFYFYFFDKSAITQKFSEVFMASSLIGYGVFFILSSLRGFTLIPVTYFIIVGLVFIKPVPLYIMTIIGVIISSSCVYYFSEYLNFDEYFETNHKKQIDKIKSVIAKNELALVVTWSFMPFLPTDVMCYVCGTLDVSFRKFILGVLIGEGIASAIYIFLGKEILSLISF